MHGQDSQMYKHRKLFEMFNSDTATGAPRPGPAALSSDDLKSKSSKIVDIATRLSIKVACIENVMRSMYHKSWLPG